MGDLKQVSIVLTREQRRLLGTILGVEPRLVELTVEVPEKKRLRGIDRIVVTDGSISA